MTRTERDVFSADEAVVRAWSNGPADGIPVLICNGLGAPAECWPGLADGDAHGFHVVSFFHRGTSGSGRPLDESATYLGDHATDALAVLDAYGIERAVVVGWSIGVPVAFELAHRVPDRVAAILAVCGVPQGGNGLQKIIEWLGQTAQAGALTAARAVPPGVLELITQIPVNDVTVNAVRHSGIVSSSVDPALISTVLSKYLEHDPSWYLKLARYAARSDTAGPTDVSCPVSFVGGLNDPFLSGLSVTDAAEATPGAKVDLVPGTHFLPMERPALIRDRLATLAEQAGLDA